MCLHNYFRPKVVAPNSTITKSQIITKWPAV